MRTNSLNTLLNLLTLIVIFWMNFPVNAQNKLNDSKTDTIYYNFYNDIQMIEIVYSFPPSTKAIMDYERKASMMSSIPPPPSSYHLSVYVFRNSRGEVLSVFNQKEENVNKHDFIPVTSLKTNLFHHDSDRNEKAIQNPDFCNQFERFESVVYDKNPSYFYTIYDISSIPNNVLPADFSKLTQSQHTSIITSKKGMVDTLGNLVLPTIYDEIRMYDSIFILSKDTKFSFLSISTRNISIEYDQYHPISSNLLAVKAGNLWGLIRPTRQGMTELSFDNIQYPAYSGYSSENKSKHTFITITKNNKQGVLDTNLREVIPIEFTTVWTNSFNERNYFVVTHDEKKGVINDHLTPVIPIQYQAIFPLSERSAFLVEREGKYGVIDIDGNTILPTEYDNIVGVGNTTYTVHKGGKYGIFDKAMNIIYPIELEGNLEYIRNSGSKHSFYYIKKEGRIGVYNASNKRILEPQYDRVYFLNSSITVYKEDKKEILDLNFNVLGQ